MKTLIFFVFLAVCGRLYSTEYVHTVRLRSILHDSSHTKKRTKQQKTVWHLAFGIWHQMAKRNANCSPVHDGLLSGMYELYPPSLSG